MKFETFLKKNSLREKEITIDGIDEKLTIRQLSMIEQLEMMEKNGIEAEEIRENNISIDFLKKNANFRKEIILKCLITPKIDEQTYDNLNQAGLNIFAQIADEILLFSNEATKQESKGD